MPRQFKTDRELVGEYQEADLLLKLKTKANQEMRQKMKGRAIEIDPREVKKYYKFLAVWGFQLQSLLVPDERGQSREVTKDDFFDLPMFRDIRDERERLAAAIAYLWSLQVTHNGIWAENEHRIQQYIEKPLPKD